MNPLRGQTVTLLLLVVSLASWLFFAFIQFWWLPIRKKAFDELGLSLSPACKTVFQLNSILSNEWLFLLLALCVFAATVIFFVVSLYRRSQILLMFWILLLIASPVVISGCMIMPVEMVTLKLRQGMSK